MKKILLFGVTFFFFIGACGVFSPAHAEPGAEKCPYDVQEVQRLCMDGVYDSPVARRQCYRRHDNKECREIFAGCIKKCAFHKDAARPSTDSNTPYGSLLLKRIRKEISGKECERDEDCGAVILLNASGCKTYAPASFLTINEEKLSKLLMAYNQYRMVALKESGAAPGDCPPDVDVVTACAKSASSRESVCVIKSSQ